MVLWHEADLTLGMAMRNGNMTLSGVEAIGYSLMVIGQLPTINLSGLFAN
jgi:hypothetical protein